MIRFILNDTLVETDGSPGMPLLDFIRNERGLKGTKSGCREGDCGACTVLCGELENGLMKYKTIVSCLTPLGNVRNRHMVTIEGLNVQGYSPVQQSFIDHSATQCGFCTPGFILSVTGFLISGDFSDPGNMVTALDGNICRCTGYASIVRAAGQVFQGIPEEGRNNIPWLVDHHYLPPYFGHVAGRMAQMKQYQLPSKEGRILVAGGTDLMVQQADRLLEEEANYLCPEPADLDITISGNRCFIGSSVTMSQLMNHPVLKRDFPGLTKTFTLIASTPVRNLATVAGNIVNASPIGDLSVILLALDATLLLEGTGETHRSVRLRDFFTGYKTLAMKENERVKGIYFQFPDAEDHFHFEKVSKRTHLDIASVNTAIFLTITNGRIEKAGLSAGGVAPVPLFLAKTSGFLTGKYLTEETISGALAVMQEEIRPISDIRGSNQYKSLLLRQLLLAHFAEMFPGLLNKSFVTQFLLNDEKH